MFIFNIRNREKTSKSIFNIFHLYPFFQKEYEINRLWI